MTRRKENTPARAKEIDPTSSHDGCMKSVFAILVSIGEVDHSLGYGLGLMMGRMRARFAGWD